MSKLIKIPMIQSLIIELRGQRIILDRDLAMLYQVPTRTLNQAVRRNRDRFPKDFVFQLTGEEWDFLRSQIVIANKGIQKVRSLPYAFTRNGANMVCTVLRSPIAVQRSIQIMRAFSALEEVVSKKRKTIIQSPDILKELSVHSKAIMRLFQEDKLNKKEATKVKRIQYEMINLLQQMIIESLKEE